MNGNKSGRCSPSSLYSKSVAYNCTLKFRKHNYYIPSKSPPLAFSLPLDRRGREGPGSPICIRVVKIIELYEYYGFICLYHRSSCCCCLFSLSFFAVLTIKATERYSI